MRPGWNWAVELGTRALKAQLARAFAMPEIVEARRYLDSVTLNSSALSEVNITPCSQKQCRGRWFVPNHAPYRGTLLYLHGGGYSFYPKAHADLIALITGAAKTRTFALDYRLSPEHRFPAQLEDAVHAYRWLLDTGVAADDLAVAGDSAGGNLALALLLTLRDLKLPLPALAIALSPPTDFDPPEDPGRASQFDADVDWIDRQMLVKWADWFCSTAQRRDPLVSPVYADLRGLPPIYIQAGSAEILYPSIQAFADCARRQGANVVLETWAEMNHNFQMFGYCAPQSTQALQRLGEVVDSGLRPAEAEGGRS
jgi:acetyl esterase/lipase